MGPIHETVHDKNERKKKKELKKRCRVCMCMWRCMYMWRGTKRNTTFLVVSLYMYPYRKFCYFYNLISYIRFFIFIINRLTCWIKEIQCLILPPCLWNFWCLLFLLFYLPTQHIIPNMIVVACKNLAICILISPKINSMRTT